LSKQFGELKLEDFNSLTLLLIKTFRESIDINDNSFYSNKENNKIIDFLNKILEKDFKVENKAFTTDELQIIRIFHSELCSIFNKTDNDRLETLFNNFISRFSSSSTPFSLNKNNNTEPLLSSHSSNEPSQVLDSEEIQKFDDLVFINKNCKRLVYLTRKILRYENHKTIMKLHRDKQIPTTPSQLFYINFPEPFFPSNQEFIDSYNEIIERTQGEICRLISSTVDSTLKKLADDMVVL